MSTSYCTACGYPIEGGKCDCSSGVPTPETNPIEYTGETISVGTPGTFNLVTFVMKYESGNVTEDEIIEGFQHLIDTGQAWRLQGHYGRTAAALIDMGVCAPAAA